MSGNVINFDVRTTWQLLPNEFKVKGFAKEDDKQVLGKIAMEMGVKGTIQAVPYKFLLYEPGK